MTHLITATYWTVEDAHGAAAELLKAGFPKEKISFVAGDNTGEFEKFLNHGDMQAEEGAGAGAAFGAIVGFFTGLATISVPGVGPILAAGSLLAGLTGAGIGAAAGGATGAITAALVDRGIDEADAEYYTQVLQRGAFLVAVETPDKNDAVERATEVLSSYNPIDIENVLENWRAEDGTWLDFDETAGEYRETMPLPSQGISPTNQEMVILPPYPADYNYMGAPVRTYDLVPPR